MMSAPDREPVGQAVNSILFILEMIGGMALKQEHFDEVAAEEIVLGRIVTQAQLILSYIKERREQPKLRLVQ